MNWIDIALIIVILLTVIAGWYRGFILGSLDLITWIGSLVLGYLFYSYTAIGLSRLFDLGVWLLPVSFILTVVIVRILIGLVTRYIIRAVPETANSGAI